MIRTRIATRPIRAAALAAAALAALAATASVPSARAVAAEGSAFEHRKYPISGTWSVVETDGGTVVRFDEAFETEGGPDLKVFLSPTPMETVDGGTATAGSVLLGELVSTAGAQEYTLPEGVDIADFESVLVHCEEFGVLWGGGAL